MHSSACDEYVVRRGAYVDASCHVKPKAARDSRTSNVMRRLDPKPERVLEEIALAGRTIDSLRAASLASRGVCVTIDRNHAIGGKDGGF
jgi:hypothetical protein